MSVYDRWHRTRPRPGDKPCEHRDRVRGQLYPSRAHGQGQRYQVRWRDEDDRQQKRNFDKKAGTDPETCADAFDAKIQHELNAGTYIDPSAGDISFETLGRQIIASRTVDAKTREHMEQRLQDHVYPVIGLHSMKLLSQRPSMIQNLVRTMEGEGVLAPSSIGIVMKHVVTIFAVAVDDGIIGKNPCRSRTVVLPKAPDEELVPWTRENVWALREDFATPPGRGRRVDLRRYAALVDAGAGLGMREGELFALSPDDIDWLRGVVTVQRQLKTVGGKLVFALPKGEKIRKVPLSESVKLSLSRHLEAFPAVPTPLPWRTPDGKPRTVKLMFTTASGRPIRSSNFGTMWRPAVIRAGIAPQPTDEAEWELGNGRHALRHFFASELITQGESIKAVSRWLGHAKIQITLDLYTHLMPDSEVRMRTILDGALYPEEVPSAPDVPSEG